MTPKLLKVALVIIISLLVSGCAAQTPPRQSYPQQQRRPDFNDPNEIVRGCEIYNTISTANVRVIFHHKCVHWKRLIIMALLSEDGPTAAKEATQIVKSELGADISLHVIMRTRMVFPFDPGSTYYVMIVGVRGNIKPRDPNKRYHF